MHLCVGYHRRLFTGSITTTHQGCINFRDPQVDTSHSVGDIFELDVSIDTNA